MSDSQIETITTGGPPPRHIYQNIGFVLGPALGLLLFLLPAPQDLSPEGWKVIAMMAWMAVWWATEAVPVPATSLIPLVYLPMTGVRSAAEAAAPYAHPVILLLLGGFIVAMAMQRWDLHRRIALNILARVAASPAALIGGFMLACALLSMWVSNTATTLMMVPIAMSVAQAIVGEDRPSHPFTVALLLGVAYSASIGGLGTPVGTPPNLLVRGYLEDNMGVSISFPEWMAFGIPIVAVLLVAAWLVLTRWTFDIEVRGAGKGRELVREKLAAMGAITPPEFRTAVLFAVVGGLWMFRPLIAKVDIMSGISDMGIAVFGALMTFVIPSGSTRAKGSFLLDWDWAVRIPWGVLLLFGGGMSMAAAVSSTGLAEWLGDLLSVLTTYPTILLLLALVTMVIFLTELTSNTATTAAMLPVLGAIAVVGSIDPILLAAPAAMAASCAFMLPVATGPNAIVFAGGQVHIPDMVRAGFRLNILGIFVISALCYAMLPLIFGE